jgi:hypothetical protein
MFIGWTPCQPFSHQVRYLTRPRKNSSKTFSKESCVVSRAPPELNLRIGPFSVNAKGTVAVKAVRWPVAFAIVSLVPLAIVLTIYTLSHIAMLRPIFRQWWS